MVSPDSFRVIAISDLHIGQDGRQEIVQQTIADIAEKNPDALIIGGDITQNGTVAQALLAARILSTLDVPKFAVVGNHDHWSAQPEEVMQILQKEAKVNILNGHSYHVEKGQHTLGITGTEGYSPHVNGEDRTQEGNATIDGQDVFNAEVIKLQDGLQGLRGTSGNLVVLHYAPGDTHDLATLHGEKEIYYPYVGSRRFAHLVEEHNTNSPYSVDAIIHGHTDKGSGEGQTSDGVPVFNVSMKAAGRQDRPLFRELEIPFRRDKMPFDLAS